MNNEHIFNDIVYVHPEFLQWQFSEDKNSQEAKYQAL